jgi:hypothetical protein
MKEILKKMLNCCCKYKEKNEEDNFDEKYMSPPSIENIPVKPSYKIKVIIPKSIATGAEAIYEIEEFDIKFRLFSDNFNYFDYFDPNMIKNIYKNSDWVVTIELDRYKIRHWAHRSLMINLKSKEILWIETDPDRKRCDDRIELIKRNEIVIC